jgi:ParB family chromosome partitioning protein
MWQLHERLDCYITEETCRAEIESFERRGQLMPVLGRKLHGDPDHDVELIYGARRLFVARHINQPLLVELRELSDQESIVAMDIENRHRTDISPYERGLSYARWLRAGYFQSQEDIASTLKVSCSQVSRLMKFARLPSVIVDAFSSPLDICEGWGVTLMEILDDPERREATLRKARAISSNLPRPSGRDVYQELLSASESGNKPARSQEQVVKDVNGSPLFRVRHQQNTIALVMPLEMVSAECLDKVCRTVAGILQRRAVAHLRQPAPLRLQTSNAPA